MHLEKNYTSKVNTDMKIRHPEKQKNSPSLPMRKPDWLRVRSPGSKGYFETKGIVDEFKLKTVCEEAACPNIGDCWMKKHATFLIMGDICTRGCAFCNIATGRPENLDPFEPLRVAKSVEKLSLKHVVLTSVDRDDLNDGGAEHIARTVDLIRKHSKLTSIEVLTPDFLHAAEGSAERVIRSKPDVFNHNVETVPSKYLMVRPGARYFSSLRLLQFVKELDDNIFTKSGLMVGMGETHDELFQVMDDLRSANVDFLTIGQYLQPTPKHYPVNRFVDPEEFKLFEKIAYGKGFLLVSSSPLTRSSFHADEDFEKLSKMRQLKFS